jgi:hypothetical protein
LPVKAFIIPYMINAFNLNAACAYNAHAAFKLRINNVEFVNKELKFDNVESPGNASSFLVIMSM